MVPREELKELKELEKADIDTIQVVEEMSIVRVIDANLKVVMKKKDFEKYQEED